MNLLRIYEKNLILTLIFSKFFFKEIKTTQKKSIHHIKNYDYENK